MFLWSSQGYAFHHVSDSYPVANLVIISGIEIASIRFELICSILRVCCPTRSISIFVVCLYFSRGSHVRELFFHQEEGQVLAQSVR